MTPTQWLAIPTEIRLAELPPRVTSSQNDATETPAVYVNGKKIIVKQEDVSTSESSAESGASSVYLYPMKNQVLTSQEGVQRLARECPPSSVNNFPSSTQSTPTDVIIIRSKPKNPDYKFKDDILATKRSRPVNFRVLGVKPGLEIVISLSYQGHIFGDEPVKRCKKHDECTWCKEHEFNQCFCIISKFHHYELDVKRQPRAILRPQAEHLSPDGSAEFSVVFACWNSCDLHARFGKDMALHIHICDGQVRRIEYGVQCCQNLLRDAFKDRKRKLVSRSSNTQEISESKEEMKPKRKDLDSTAHPQCASKTPTSTTTQEPPPSPPSSPITINEKPVDIVVEGLDEERRDLIERLVRTMGGSTYRIPHLIRLKPCDNSTAEHQSNCISK